MAETIAGRRLLLVGNPNAGKSTLFNLLTGGHAHVGNWHGVTVGAAEGRGKGALEGYVLCDLPGVYSLDAMSMEERLARDAVLRERTGVVLFVSECAHLQRALPLLQALRPERCVLLLTKEKPFRQKGGRLNAALIGRKLGIPVIVTDRKGRKQLSREIAAAVSSGGEALRLSRQSAGEALGNAYTPVREGLSLADRLLTCAFFTVPLFFALLLLAFFVTFAKGGPGDLMKAGVESLFSDVLAPLCDGFSPVARSFFQDGLLRGLGSVFCFLPQIALLFTFLILMEESGFLSRLAALCDGFFSTLGLNGRAVFSLVMGFGCTAAAVLTTRGLEDKQIQRRVILCLPYIPCSAKLPVFLTLCASFFENPFLGVALLYVLGTAVSVLVALFLKREAQPLCMELAPLCVPRLLFVLKSLCFQIKQFIMKVATVILAFLMLSWLLSSFDFSFCLVGIEESMLAGICGWLQWLFAPVGMADWRIAYAALSGIVAKENIAGAIAMFYGAFPYGGASAFAFAVFVLACTPCVSAIAATAREVGLRRALLYAAVQTGSALLLCYLCYFALAGGGYLMPLALPLAAAGILFWRRRREKLSGKRRLHPESLHR